MASQEADFNRALFCDSRSLKEKEKKLSRVHILHIFLHCNFTSSIAIEDNRQFYTHTHYIHTYTHTISPLWPLAVTAKQLTSSKCSFCRCVVHKYVVIFEKKIALNRCLWILIICEFWREKKNSGELFVVKWDFRRLRF